MAVSVNPSKNEVTATRSLRKSGSSTVISFPPQVLEALELGRGDDLRIVADWEEGEIRLVPVDPTQ